MTLYQSLDEIDGAFNLFGQQIQHKSKELQDMQEERLRLQGRYAQRETTGSAEQYSA